MTGWVGVVVVCASAVRLCWAPSVPYRVYQLLTRPLRAVAEDSSCLAHACACRAATRRAEAVHGVREAHVRPVRGAQQAARGRHHPVGQVGRQASRYSVGRQSGGGWGLGSRGRVARALVRGSQAGGQRRSRRATRAGRAASCMRVCIGHTHTVCPCNRWTTCSAGAVCK